MATSATAACAFCGARALRAWKHGAYHPRVPTYGPFDLSKCANCGSIVTDPAPSPETLNEFYLRFTDGLHPELIDARRDSPQLALYSRFVDRVASFAAPREGSTWIDLAAGTGIFTQLMALRFPASSGIGIDLHAKPAFVTAPNVSWLQRDLNTGTFSDIAPADIVVALAVFEHVRAIEDFLTTMITLVKPNGSLYIMCPDAGSLAAKIMGPKWPYYLPGEHIHMPTIRGARSALERALGTTGRRLRRSRIRAVPMEYTLRYLAAYLHLPFRNAIPPGASLPIPAGVLEIAAQLD